jgi:O-antigen/teichoic acid export membrane protein
MRSAGVSNRAAQPALAGGLTVGESSFRNAKLGRVALVSYKAAADLAAKGSFFLLTIVAARRLTPAAFGLFALGTTIGWMLSVVADGGVQMHVARRVARAPHLARTTLDRWWRTRVAALALAIAALIAGLAIVRASLAMSTPLVLFGLAYAATSGVDLLNYFYRGLSRTDIESTLTLWQRLATLTLGTAALLWRPDVNLLALAMLAAAAGTLACSLTIARRLGSTTPVVDPTIRAATTSDRFFRDVFPIGAGIVLSAIYFRVDTLLVQWLAGSEAVARYNAVFRLVDALRLFPAAVLAVALPALCRAEDLAALARLAASLTFIGVAIALAVWLAADRIVTLTFGDPYRSAVPALRILALAFPLLSLNFALTHQLVGWDRHRAYAIVCAVALAINLALNAWLIPLWSIEGAAWATLATEGCVTAGCVAALGART